ncbi:hypothetical protein AV530_004807 [Patagioenas fasciata monilis]|uniref:Uncharacterized protein n=1 Tax=Patagioenas fasciata monilis TaxID=372326 RepID=A0A1V4KDX8_PATFA|nr:hypothetical protein AV530_004807 [Patagioenas fasciata monilis]
MSVKMNWRTAVTQTWRMPDYSNQNSSEQPREESTRLNLSWHGEQDKLNRSAALISAWHSKGETQPDIFHLSVKQRQKSSSQ